jgi:hypothetical protein
MDKFETIQRIVMLLLLFLVVPGDGTDLARLINFVISVIILLIIILLSMVHIDGINIIIPEALLEKVTWIVVFISAIGILIIKLLNTV